MKLKTKLLGVGIIGLFISCSKKEPAPNPYPGPEIDSHFHLNIIGKPDEKKNGDLQGSRLFVLRHGTTKVWLAPGPFGLSTNKLSDTDATLFVPYPDADRNGFVDYKVIARPLATPGGSAKITLCATDAVTGEVVCSESHFAVRSKGTPKESDISENVFYISADLNTDGLKEMYPLFHTRFKDYYLKYENYGLKLLQIHYYNVR